MPREPRKRPERVEGPVRVKDPRLGEYTVARPWSKDQQVLKDERAVGGDGRHLPAKPKRTVNQAAAAKSGDK